MKKREETGIKRDGTGRNRKKQKKPEETGRNWKKQGKTGRYQKKLGETQKNTGKKTQEETERNGKKIRRYAFESPQKVLG